MQSIVNFLLMLGMWNKYGVVGKKECEIIVVKWKSWKGCSFIHICILIAI